MKRLPLGSCVSSTSERRPRLAQTVLVFPVFVV